VAASKRASELLARLPIGPVIGAELGIWKGKMSEFLLKREDLTLYMVDSWLAVKGLEDRGFTEDEQARNRLDALRRTDFANDRRIVMHMDSEVAALTMPEESLDFVFIDADHSYGGVKKDIRVWLPKLKRGALLSGHDYDNPNERNGREVKRAVDEAVAENGWRLKIGADSTWFVRMPL